MNLLNIKVEKIKDGDREISVAFGQLPFNARNSLLYDVLAFARDEVAQTIIHIFAQTLQENKTIADQLKEQNWGNLTAQLISGFIKAVTPENKELYLRILDTALSTTGVPDGFNILTTFTLEEIERNELRAAAGHKKFFNHPFTYLKIAAEAIAYNLFADFLKDVPEVMTSQSHNGQ